MSDVTIAHAKDQLPRLVHQAESGTPVHLTRRGKPVAVLIGADEYARLTAAAPAASLWEAIEAMRASPGFEPVNWSDEEVAAWRQQSHSGRNFSWDD